MLNKKVFQYDAYRSHVSVFEGRGSVRETLDRWNMGPETEIPLEGTWDQSARQEVTSYRDPSPQWTDTCELNITLPQTSFAGGN